MLCFPVFSRRARNPSLIDPVASKRVPVQLVDFSLAFMSREIMRLKHSALRTETSYGHSFRQAIPLNSRPPPLSNLP